MRGLKALIHGLRYAPANLCLRYISSGGTRLHPIEVHVIKAYAITLTGYRHSATLVHKDGATRA